MIWMWLGLGLVVVLILGRAATSRSPARTVTVFPEVSQASRRPPRNLERSPHGTAAAPGPRTVRELGQTVGRDHDDRDAPARKLVDNFNVGIEFEYRNSEGYESRRKVMIDGVYGDSLDWPLYVLGYDTLSRERRTFNLERITALHRQDGGDPLVEAIPYWVGSLVRQEVGLPILPPPFERDLDAPVMVTEKHSQTRAERVRTGSARRLKMTYGPRGRVLELEVFGRLAKGAPSLKLYKIEPRTDRVWCVTSVACGLSGEIIDDLVAWSDPEGEAPTAA